MSAQNAIEASLRELWAHLRRESLRDAGLTALTSSALGLGVALVVAQLGFVGVALAIFLAGFLGGLAWLGFVAWKRGVLGAHDLLARLAERLAPELGTAPSSAIHLGRQLHADDPSFSHDLANEHLERTAEELKRVDLPKRLQADHKKERQKRLVIAAVVGVVALGLLVSLKQGRNRLVSFMLDPNAAELVDVPLAGDLRITYRYPAYTGQKPHVIEGGDGSIAAVAGTEVELQATTEEPTRRAELILEGGPAQVLPMQLEGDRTLRARFTLTTDGRYHFRLVTKEGDKLEERLRHPIQAVPDAYPEIRITSPLGDVELRDDKAIPLQYEARDDFGVSEVTLVVEPAQGEAKRQKLAGGEAAQTRDGGISWNVAELGLTPGSDAVFYLEAIDNDTVSGPKKSTSQKKHLSLFSARKHHEDLVALQQKVVDMLIDWLGADLEAPADVQVDVGVQKRVVERIGAVQAELVTLVGAMRDDKLSDRGMTAAWANIFEHVQKAQRERARLVSRLESPTANKPTAQRDLVREQKSAIAQLEKDVIYLDDLLALERIDELKRTSKDLLAAQRELSDLLEQFKKTQDPALKAQLDQKMRDLKKQMLDLLAKMAEIKKQLPGEYRNLESASQLAVDDQLQRLEKKLKDGDLEGAAQELEQLANMVENMANQLDRAEDEYGGERYAEARQELEEFAQQFKELEQQQEQLAKRQEQLTKQYRDKAMQKAGSDMNKFVEKARQKTAEALKQLDQVGAQDGLYGVQDSLEASRQRLLDLDGLLAQKDFSEAARIAREALRSEESLRLIFEQQLGRYNNNRGTPEVRDAKGATSKAQDRTQEVADMLDKLFPEPGEVLSKEQQRELQQMSKKQGDLQGQADKLEQKMNELAQQIPLFGGEPRGQLQGAQNEMGQSKRDLEGGSLPSGSQHGRRAADQLAKLRQQLEQASKGGKGGMPLPLGGQGGGQRDGGEGGEMRPDEEVAIPSQDKNAAPKYRKELMDAAKQKAPEHYEEAVRKYYEELIR